MLCSNYYAKCKTSFYGIERASLKYANGATTLKYDNLKIEKLRFSQN